MKEITTKSFIEFCKNNIPLVFAVTFTLFFTHGIKLFRTTISIDAELYSYNKISSYAEGIGQGRFGQALLKTLLFPMEWNPYAAFFIGFCMIWVFTISWCYVVSIFNNNIKGNNYLVPFAVLFMTMPTWVDIAIFFVTEDFAIIITLCPYTIYLFYKGFLDNEKEKIVIASILLVLMIAIYQAVVCMFCCGVFACFLLLQEKSDYEPKVYRNLCIKLFISLIGASVCYFVINKFVIFILRIENVNYFDRFIYWNQRSVKEIIFNTFQSAYQINDLFKAWKNPFLFPIVAAFLVKIIYIAVKIIPSGRRLLYFLAGIGIPLSVFFLIIAAGGTMPPNRTLFALPLAVAFMLFYIMKTQKKKIAIAVASISLLLAFFQLQYMAQLLYTDQMRYNDDVHIAYKLEKLVNQVQPPEKKLPIMFVGSYITANRFRVNWLQMDTVGYSFFSVNSWDAGRSRERAFMATLGINFDEANEEQKDLASKEAISMPSYPNPNCVRNVGDFIVIKLPY